MRDAGIQVQINVKKKVLEVAILNQGPGSCICGRPCLNSSQVGRTLGYVPKQNPEQRHNFGETIQTVTIPTAGVFQAGKR